MLTVEPSSPAPATPVVTSDYLLGPMLGRGATAIVYEATDVRTNARVALKLFRTELQGDERIIRRFLREARSLASLQHPHIIEVVRSGRGPDGTPFLVMELVRGRTLARALREDGPFELDRIVGLTSQLLQALSAAHAVGILHRDIKPSNVMIATGPPESVKVCDFGIAKAFQRETATSGADRDATSLTAPGDLCGTPEYMSPEQARGEPLDPRSDLYAVAVILYQMITGRPPFRAESQLGIISRLLVDLPERPSRSRPDIAPGLEALILSGLAKRREERPSSADEFLGRLWEVTKALGPTPLARARESHSDAETFTPRRRSRARAARAAAILMVTLGALGVLWLGVRGAPPPAVVPVPKAAPPAVVAPAMPDFPVLVPPTAAPEQPASPARRSHPARASRPAPPATRLAAAEAQLARRDAEGACAQAEQVRSEQPSNPDVHRFLGKCYMRLGRIADARRAYQRFLDLAPNDAGAPFVRAILAR